MNYLSGLHVLILGLGDSGLAMARWCVRCGAARVVVADTRTSPPQAESVRQSLPSVELHLGVNEQGQLPLTLLEGVQALFKSPGLAPRDPQLLPLLTHAEQMGLPARGELSLFASALADLKTQRGYDPKVIAITGTNGKTTTTSLTAQLVERSGWRVGLAGNIGPTLLDTLSTALDQEPWQDIATTSVEESTPELAAPVAADSAIEDALQEGADPHADTPELLADPVASAEDVALLMQLDGVTSVDVDAVESVELDALPDAQDGGDAVEEDMTPAPAPVVVTDEEIDAAAEAGGGPPPHLIPPPPPGPTFEVLPQAWVLELSSFQLDGVSNFDPTVATVLNVAQDHLDWHGDMAAYAAAKARIFGKNALMVINADDPVVEAMIPAPIPVKGRGAKPIVRKVQRFGLSAPRHPGDFGLIHDGVMAWLVRAMESDETLKRKKSEEEEIVIQRLMPADALRIRGRHNAANALAALALATGIGRPLAPMLHGLREYTGEPHRVEFIGTVQGVDAVDDSKGTNVGATVAALQGLGADREGHRLVVILGGDGKGQDFAPLAAPVTRYARAVALIGRDASTIEKALSETGVTMAHFDTLEAATQWCFERAHPGDAVLLSPACASLDMFRNYAHRAEVFAATVQQIAAERGEALA